MNQAGGHGIVGLPSRVRRNELTRASLRLIQTSVKQNVSAATSPLHQAVRNRESCRTLVPKPEFQRTPTGMSPVIDIPCHNR